MNVKKANNCLNSKVTILLSMIGGGGTERVALNLLNGLPTQFNTKLITLYSSTSVYYNGDFSFLCKYSINQFVRILCIPYSICRYIKKIKHSGSTISLSMDGPTNIINLVATISGVQSVISYHVMPSHSRTLLSKLDYAIQSILINLTQTNIIAVSNGVKAELISMFQIKADKIHVIYNPIDIQKINQLSAMNITNPLVNKLISNNIKLIITVARLSSEKSLYHTIRTLSVLIREINVVLLICGDGPEREYLEHLSMSLNISDKVIFLGWQENPFKYITKSTVFVQSSLTEALPNVLVEALACGCPVVAANCSSGIEEILGSDNTCGFIAEKMTGIRHTADEPLDSGEQSLLFYMKKILNDPDLRESMSKAGKERAELFDMEVGIRKYTELIEELSKKA